MKSAFTNLPITKKLRRLQAVTVGLALVFTLLVSSITEFWDEHHQMLTDTQSTGNMIGFNASAALLFNDSKSATDILAALYSKPTILGAQLYTLDGTPFARYISNQLADNPLLVTFPTSLADGAEPFQQNRIMALSNTVIQPISQNDETVGYLYLVTDLRPMWRGLFNNLCQISLVMLVAFFLSALYGRYLATLISAPLVHLSLLAQQVSREKNYSLRAQGESKDEIGQLVKSFNRMIKQIQERDTKLEKQRSRLEIEVELRTADFRKAAAEAQAANLTKSQFLANMSHEIRTPMNGVLGMTELLLSTPLSTTQKRYAKTIFSSADALLAIINDILDFSKIEAGKMELEEIDFSLADLFDQLMTLFFKSARAKQIELICNIDPAVPDEIRGDAYRLRQILTNLLSNAIKFTDTGSVKLQVSNIEPSPYEPNDVMAINFCVKDTGIGIAPDILSNLFKPFSQADNSTTRKYGGTGLGLAICKELSELMGGTIRAESEPEQGATFIVQMPLRKALLTIPTESRQDAGLCGKRALIVENDPVNIKTLSSYLVGFGMEFSIAETGANALEMLDKTTNSEHAYDVALVGMKIQDVNATEFSRHIRKNARFNDLRIVMMAFSEHDNEPANTQTNDCDLFLCKPLRRRSLQNTLLNLIANKQSNNTRYNSLQGLRVLLAEDNPINQEITKAMLDKMGCDVQVVVNGLEALELFKRGNCDLILMDCMMPDMDGYTATRAIRNLESASNSKPIPILALTANAREDDRNTCLTIGMNDYLAKPFLLNALREKIINLVTPHIITDEPNLKLPSPSEDDTVRFDPAPLSALRNMGGDALAANVLHLFRNNVARLIDALEEAMHQQDTEAVRQAAHSVKSAAANVGSLYLSKLACNIEQAARENSLTFDHHIVEDLKAEFRHVLQIISQQE